MKKPEVAALFDAVRTVVEQRGYTLFMGWEDEEPKGVKFLLAPRGVVRPEPQLGLMTFRQLVTWARE